MLIVFFYFWKFDFYNLGYVFFPAIHPKFKILKMVNFRIFKKCMGQKYNVEHISFAIVNNYEKINKADCIENNEI